MENRLRVTELSPRFSRPLFSLQGCYCTSWSGCVLPGRVIVAVSAAFAAFAALIGRKGLVRVSEINMLVEVENFPIDRRGSRLEANELRYLPDSDTWE